MAKITLNGDGMNTCGNLPTKGEKAPDFVLVNTELADVKLSDLAGKKTVLNIFPSIDTPVCARSMKAFYEKLANKDSVEVFNVAADLPFAFKRHCTELGSAKNIHAVSTFRSDFAKTYGMKIEDGVLKGLCARGVVVLDEQNNVIHSELVDKLENEPNYDQVLAVL